MHTRCSCEIVKKIDNLEDVELDGKIILNFVLNEENGRKWTGFTWLRIWRMAKCYVHSNKH
jgi:hypothetical protein